VNNLSQYSIDRIKLLLQNEIEIKFVENKDWSDISQKNSFWKYIPIRTNINKYELLLDNDLILWKIPEIIRFWYNSENLLINSDWNGTNYGEVNFSRMQGLNAGILGYPPNYNFKIPDIKTFTDYFHTEQGYIVITFFESGKKIEIIPQNEIFQSNANEYIEKPINNIIDKFCGGHFCGCTYSHYFHWDKYYKNQIWKYFYEHN